MKKWGFRRLGSKSAAKELGPIHGRIVAAAGGITQVVICKVIRHSWKTVSVPPGHGSTEGKICRLCAGFWGPQDWNP